MKTLPVALVWLTFVCTNGSSPQDAHKPVAAAGQDKKLVLEAGPHRLEELVDESARFLGRNCICSPVELAAAGAGANRQIDLQKRLELDAKGCEEVVSQLLYMLGLVVTRVHPAHELYECIHVNGPRRGDIANRAMRLSPEEVMIRTGLKMVVTCSVPLKHINAQNLSNVLRPFFSTGSNSGAVMALAAVEPRSLCMTGFADEVAKCIRMVQEADQPQEKVEPGVDERLAKIEARLAALEKKAGEPK